MTYPAGLSAARAAKGAFSPAASIAKPRRNRHDNMTRPLEVTDDTEPLRLGCGETLALAVTLPPESYPTTLSHDDLHPDSFGASPRLAFDFGGESWQVFETHVFDHLWFLLFLAWLVAGFALASVVGLLPTGRCRWWLLPASVLPAALMLSPYGPDTARAPRRAPAS